MENGKNNSQINLVMVVALFLVIGTINVALFVSPKNVEVLVTLASTLTAAIVTIAVRDQISNILKHAGNIIKQLILKSKKCF